MIRINVSELDNLARNLSKLGKGDFKRHVIQASVNKVGRRTGSFAAREVRDEGGFQRLSTVRQGLSFRPQTRATDHAEIKLKGRHHTLAQFSPSPRYQRNGQSFRRAKPWNQTRKYSGFWANGIPFVRRGKGRFPIKALYGPNPAIVLRREAQDAVIEKITTELPREINRYAAVRMSQRYLTK